MSVPKKLVDDTSMVQGSALGVGNRRWQSDFESLLWCESESGTTMLNNHHSRFKKGNNGLATTQLASAGILVLNRLFLKHRIIVFRWIYHVDNKKKNSKANSPFFIRDKKDNFGILRGF